MSIKIPKILVVAPSRKTRGGITSVVSAYESSSIWGDWDCVWIETHIDKSIVSKLIYFFSSFFAFLYHLPSSSIVHIHLSEPMSAFRKSFFFVSALLFGKKIIIHFHSFSIQSTINGKFKLLYKFLFKYSSSIVVLSGKWKEDLIQYVPLEKEKIIVISNPSSNTLTYNSYNPADKTILYAGTLNSRKGYADLLKAFKLLCVDNSDYSLAFAGNGELSNAKEMVNDLHISDRVKFYGWVTGIEKKDLFLKASIFCLPSYAEGFPMAVIDALSYGIPVITTPVGGLPDILVDNHDVLYFTPGDVESLYLLLKKLINDVSLKEQLSNNGFQAACANFQITSISKKVDNLYHHLLES